MKKVVGGMNVWWLTWGEREGESERERGGGWGRGRERERPSGTLHVGKALDESLFTLPGEAGLLASLEPHFEFLQKDKGLRKAVGESAHSLSLSLSPAVIASLTAVTTTLSSYLHSLLSPVDSSLLRETSPGVNPTSLFIPHLFIAKNMENSMFFDKKYTKLMEKSTFFDENIAKIPGIFFIICLINTQLFSEWVELRIGGVDAERRVEMEEGREEKE